jgi:hypothetical protein
MSENMDAQSNSTPSEDKPVVKRAYTKPLLIEYGSVRDFTRGPGGTRPDTKAGSYTGG